jgi:hypothetical protein
MDYKYIQQLLDHYWKCETSLEEEDILRAFFSQKEVPTDLLPYKDLFSYETSEKKKDVLGEDFDQKILSKIEGSQNVKARIIPMRKRLMPLFKAAAVVAIFLSLGNAAQMAFDESSNTPSTSNPKASKGESVAMGDSAMVDSLQQSSIEPITPQGTIIK